MESDYIIQGDNLGAKISRFNVLPWRNGSRDTWPTLSNHGATTTAMSSLFWIYQRYWLITSLKFMDFLNIAYLIAKECFRIQRILKRRLVLGFSCLKPVEAKQVLVCHVTLPAPTLIQWRGRRSRTCLREMCWIKKRGRRQEENQEFTQTLRNSTYMLFLFIFNSLNLDRGIC